MQSPILSYSPLIHVKVESLWLANRTSWCLAQVWSLSPSYDSEMSRSPVGKTTSTCSTCSPSYDSEMTRSPVGKITSTCSKSVLPNPSVQLSTRCRRPVWVHWKIFQGWGLTQVRDKKPAILFAVCQHKALLLFLKCCVFFLSLSIKRLWDPSNQNRQN